MSFDQFDLSKEILKAIAEKGYTEPTEIQSRVIPLILEGKDILGEAQTGTGKTAGFMLPILNFIQKAKQGKSSSRPKALILVPTRELAAQVHESAMTYGKYLHLRSAAIFGGVPIRAQMMKLKKGVDLLVATPGRLLDHVGQKSIDLSEVEYFVLDEADCMLDMGFIPDIRKIISMLPEHKQSLLFSATFSSELKKLAKDLLNEPAFVQVARKNAPAESVEQVMYPVDRDRKHELLYELLTTNPWEQVLIFTRTKHGANKLYDRLKSEDIRSDVIHGGKSQGARTKALANFKGGKVRVLVATDIAARGLDIAQLPCVINYDLPIMASDYVHRIGRTGRAGHNGLALSLVCIDEHMLLNYIEELIQKPLTEVVLPGFEVDASIKAQPILRAPKKRLQKGKTASNRDFKPRGSGEFKPRGNGEFKPRGNGEFKPRGNGEFKPRGNGEFKPRGNGESKPRGNGEFKPRGNGESKPRGSGEFKPRGNGEFKPKNKGFRPQKGNGSKNKGFQPAGKRRGQKSLRRTRG